MIVRELPQAGQVWRAGKDGDLVRVVLVDGLRVSYRRVTEDPEADGYFVNLLWFVRNYTHYRGLEYADA